MNITVTKMHTITRAGANGRPTSGDVSFADGKDYGWLTHALTGDIVFFNWRKREGTWERYSFSSPARAAALLSTIG